MGSWAFCSQLLINNASSIPCFALHLNALTRNISKSLKRKSHASMDLFIFYNPLTNNATSIPCFRTSSQCAYAQHMWKVKSKISCKHGFSIYLFTSVVYLSRQMILPFERSYGDISIVTLSPGRILI